MAFFPIAQDFLAAQGQQAGGIMGLTHLGQAGHSDRVAILTAHLQDELQRALSLTEPPDPHRGFFELGIDSLMATDLGTRLSVQLGGSCLLGPTTLFDYPTVAHLAAYIATELCGVPSSPNFSVEHPVKTALEPAGLVSGLTEEELDSLLATRMNELSHCRGEGS
jgi:acyl carrier protein